MSISNRLNNSWQRIYRNRQLVAKKLGLSDQEYRLWDLYIAVNGWDKRYEESYQAVHATDKQIAGILGWSQSKVCRTRSGLVKKGVIRERARSIQEMLLLPGKLDDIAQLQNKDASMHEEISDLEDKNANLQPIQGKNDNDSLVSYNGLYFAIKTRERYGEVKNMVDNLTKQIDEVKGWLSEDPKMKAMVNEQQRLAGLMLDYEIENDLLPI